MPVIAPDDMHPLEIRAWIFLCTFSFHFTLFDSSDVTNGNICMELCLRNLFASLAACQYNSSVPFATKVVA